MTLCTIDSNSIQLRYIFNLFSYMHAIYILYNVLFYRCSIVFLKVY